MLEHLISPASKAFSTTIFYPISQTQTILQTQNDLPKITPKYSGSFNFLKRSIFDFSKNSENVNFFKNFGSLWTGCGHKVLLDLATPVINRSLCYSLSYLGFEIDSNFRWYSQWTQMA